MWEWAVYWPWIPPAGNKNPKSSPSSHGRTLQGDVCVCAEEEVLHLIRSLFHLQENNEERQRAGIWEMASILDICVASNPFILEKSEQRVCHKPWPRSGVRSILSGYSIILKDSFGCIPKKKQQSVGFIFFVVIVTTNVFAFTVAFLKKKNPEAIMPCRRDFNSAGLRRAFINWVTESGRVQALA